MPAPNTPTVTAEQFAQLLAAVRPQIAETETAAPAAPTPTSEQARITEARELASLSTDQLGRRLLQRLAESRHAPGWRVTESSEQPAAAGLTASAQSLPIGQQSMTLTEALATRHDLHSPAWTRTAGAQGARTIFDA